VGGRRQGDGGLKLRVVSVGKDRSGLFAPAVQAYAQRLSHYTRLELVELPAARTKEEEAQSLLARRTGRDWLLALDERGALLTSVEFSGLIARAQNVGADLVFIIGGDEGLAQRVRDEAKEVLSLSRMTLPHRLARVVLLEQLYRAFTLIRGEPYHK
jgi:23S rRNA (pseudouridine1915-N3)-methyltransferase